jgi:hypothetical protein
MTYDVDPVFGCRLATGRTDRDGYCFHGSKRAHIHAWEQVHGPVKPGLVLDHLCGRRSCCFVAHLEPVTQSENLKRRNWRYRMRIKTCPQGHDLKLHGAQLTTGRVCRVCNREARGVGHGTRVGGGPR